MFGNSSCFGTKSESAFDKEVRMKHLLCTTIVLATVYSVCGAEYKSQIVVEPYAADIDIMEGLPKHKWGQLLVHRIFDIETDKRIQHIPLFSIQFEGLHHQRLDGRQAFEPRAKCIAERLELAWNLLDKGGRLVKGEDKWVDWRNTGKHAPIYAPAPQTWPAIYLEHEDFEPRLRIMTVYEKDAQRFPRVHEDPNTLADYLIGMIQAHHLLVNQKSGEIVKYEALLMDGTREGKIFKEVFIRAEEVKSLRGDQQIVNETLQDALARISIPQRLRLFNLAVRAPVDIDSVLP